MTTRADLAAEIADDIDDTTGFYSSQIATAIKAAQRECERETYYFNQTRTITFTTVASQSAYGTSDNANIPTLVHIRSAWIEDSNGERTDLRRITQEEWEWRADNSASTGEPYSYTYFEQQVFLYPVPNSANYTIRLIASPYRLDVLTNGTDTNAWLTEAYDLLKARAKYILARDTLKDPELAQAMYANWTDQDRMLTGETTRRLGTGRIRATKF